MLTWVNSEQMSPLSRRRCLNNHKYHERTKKDKWNPILQTYKYFCHNQLTVQLIAKNQFVSFYIFLKSFLSFNLFTLLFRCCLDVAKVKNRKMFLIDNCSYDEIRDWLEWHFYFRFEPIIRYCHNCLTKY